MRLSSTASICLAAALAGGGCDDKKNPAPPADTEIDDTPGLDAPPGGYARIFPNTAFEGLTWHVVGVEQQGTVPMDLSGSIVSIAAEFAEDVVIREQRCNRMRCAIVLELGEFLDPVGQPIPPPISAQNVMIYVDPPTGQWMVGTLSVFPLDYTDHFTEEVPLRFRGSYMMSSFRMTSGTRLELNPGDTEGAGRLFVAGPVEIGGTVDFTGGDALGATPGISSLCSGGGGIRGGAGAGPGAGSAGAGGGGGGGGSFGGTGQPGTDGTGTGGAAGETYGDTNLASVLDAEGTECGGSGGGGSADAAGGGGGGAFLIVSLDSITLDGALLDVSGGAGGDGLGGGGGGSGGAVAMVAPTITGSATLDSTGGEGGMESGGGNGGGGGAGRFRIDAIDAGATLVLQPDYRFTGPVIDRSSLELIDTDGLVTVTGKASPGAVLRLAVKNHTGFGDEKFDAVADSEGDFTFDLTLNPGVSQLTLTQSGGGGEVINGLVGNTFEVAAYAIRGTYLYIASVPDGE